MRHTEASRLIADLGVSSQDPRLRYLAGQLLSSIAEIVHFSGATPTLARTYTVSFSFIHEY